MAQIPDTNLSVHIIWIPILGSDNREEALSGSKELQDTRVSYYWDPLRVIGDSFGQTLGLGQTAWDVYLLFAPGADWSGEVPVPDYWMHQLSAAFGKAPRLNAESLAHAAKDLLEKSRD